MNKKIIFGSISLFAVILALSYQNFGRPKQTSEIYSSLSRLDGFNAKDYRGHYFLLHFWAKWCEPCAEEIPHLIEFAAKANTSKPLKILAISLDKTLDEANSILPDRGQKLPRGFQVVLDPEHEVAERLGSFQYPETYFIGPEGEILEKWIGPQKWQKPEVIEFFKRKIAGE